MIKEILKAIHTNEENAYIVDNYPYGYKKTLKKFWIETTKRGDRLNGMTLNPKTNEWNKPKRSTYSDVMVLVKNEIGHIKTLSWGTAYTEEESLNKFLENVGDYEFNALQIGKIEQGRRVYKIREGMTFEIRAKRFKHLVTGKITTSIPLMQMSEYKEVDENDEFVE